MYSISCSYVADKVYPQAGSYIIIFDEPDHSLFFFFFFPSRSALQAYLTVSNEGELQMFPSDFLSIFAVASFTRL